MFVENPQLVEAEAIIVRKNMAKFGGPLFQAFADSIESADTYNKQVFKDNFPILWEQFLNME